MRVDNIGMHFFELVADLDEKLFYSTLDLGLALGVPRLYPAVLAAGIHHLLLIEEAEPPHDLLPMCTREIHPTATAKRPRAAVAREMHEAKHMLTSPVSFARMDQHVSRDNLLLGAYA